MFLFLSEVFLEELFDLIFGDIDGVVCVPRDIAYDVLVRAEEIERNENEIFDWVRSGDSIQEIVDKGGYF